MGAAGVQSVSLSAGGDWHCANICLVVTFYGVFDDRTSDMTLEFGDVAVFRCQMNLDRNPSPRVCLQLGMWSWEAPPGCGWPGARPLLEYCPLPQPRMHHTPLIPARGSRGNPSGSTIPEGGGVSHRLPCGFCFI